MQQIPPKETHLFCIKATRLSPKPCKANSLLCIPSSKTHIRMAPCEGLQKIFENPPPENPSLLESLSSWKTIRPTKPADHSYTELFGELHFRENTETSLPSALVSEAAASWSSGITSLLDDKKEEFNPFSIYSTKKSDTHFSAMNSESLQLCTEGLGFESLDGVDDIKNDVFNETVDNSVSCGVKAYVRGPDQYKIAKSFGSSCPPPISSVGKSGKACVSFKSYRQDGRFVLEEVRIPSQEYLHASREDGRLKLCLVQPNDDDYGDEDEEEYEDDKGL